MLNVDHLDPRCRRGQGGSGTASVERWSGGASRVDTTRLGHGMKLLHLNNLGMNINSHV